MKLNRKNNKKGFTIVELVIVIAVIGILSAILIPTFTNLTQQARDAAAREEVQNAYTAYVMDAADGYAKNAAGEETTTPLESLAQDKVAIKRGTNYFTYESNVWTDKGTSYTPGAALNGTVEYNGCVLYKLAA